MTTSSYSSLSGALNLPPQFSDPRWFVVADGEWNHNAPWYKQVGTRYPTISFKSSTGSNGVLLGDLISKSEAAVLGKDDLVLANVGIGKNATIVVHIIVRTIPIQNFGIDRRLNYYDSGRDTRRLHFSTAATRSLSPTP